MITGVKPKVNEGFITCPAGFETAKIFNSKEQANQYARQYDYDRYKPYKLSASKYVLKSMFYPVRFIKQE